MKEEIKLETAETAETVESWFDMLGVETKVGDTVYFAYGAQSDDRLHKGVIVEIKNSKRQMTNQLLNKFFIVRSHQTSRRVSRGADRVINIKPIYDNHPELFV